MSGTKSETPPSNPHRSAGGRPDKLSDFPLLRSLQDRCRAAVVKALQERPFDKHALLVSEGAEADELFMLLEGAIVLWKTRPDRHAQVTGFLFPGDVMGAANDSRYLYSARAVVRGRLASLPKRQLADLGDSYPDLRRALYRSVTSDFALAQDQLLILGAMSAKERVATALLQFDRRQRARGMDPAAPLWLPMRRMDLASYLGLELPTLSRTFSRLRQDGLISCPSTTEVSLRDRAALARMSCEALE
jgi:CRP/FNR family transcriptional regulator